MAPFKILVDGGISVGKSTLMKALVESIGSATAAYEPLKSWVDHKFTNIRSSETESINFLKEYYDNRKNFAFPFQVFATAHLLQHDFKILNAAIQNGTEVVFFERSVFSTNVFTRKAVSDNCLTPTEYEILQILMKSITQSTTPSLTEFDLIFYLRTDPHVAFERIQKRNRLEEQQVTIDYVTDITKQYDEWFAQTPSMHPNTAKYGIIPLDSNLTVEQLVDQVMSNYQLMKEKAKE